MFHTDVSHLNHMTLEGAPSPIKFMVKIAVLADTSFVPVKDPNADDYLICFWICDSQKLLDNEV